MKKLLAMLLVLACSLYMTQTAMAVGKKSLLVDPGGNGGVYPGNTSYPVPFNAASVNPKTQPPITTGYYFVDNKCTELSNFWHPTSNVLDTNWESELWVRIAPGPHMQPSNYWPAGNNGINGYAFFRSWWKGNGSTAMSGAELLPNVEWPDYWFGYDIDGNPNDVDSTDDAFAGPIPIGGGGFQFNGIRYDSFYVSTNGVIALSNRRYNYDASGSITKIPLGFGGDIYDRNSADWFDAGRRAARVAALADGPGGDGGTDDPTPDNWGFLKAVFNGQSKNGSILDNRLLPDLYSFNTGVAIIAPCWGDLHLSQYSVGYDRPEDWGKAYFKRSLGGDSLTVYWVNMAIKSNGPSIDGNGEFGYFHSFPGLGTIQKDRRPTDGSNQYCAVNVQVTLSTVDSTIHFMYEKFDGVYYWQYRNYRASLIFLWNTVAGVRGFGRHGNYDSKAPTAGAYAYNNIFDGITNGFLSWPYVGEYPQTTHYYGRYLYRSDGPGFPDNQMSVRFKTFKNVLRVIGMKYLLKQNLVDTDPAYNDKYSVVKTSDQVMDKELLAGHKQLGSFQPQAIFQNLTNDIQGIGGINYMPQDLAFRTRFVITNMATLKTVYNRSVPVNFACLNINEYVPGFDETGWLACNNTPGVKVRWVDITNYTTNTTTTTFTFQGIPYTSFTGSTFTAIPPYGYV
ncbi:MAG: hypothetical protein WCT77_10430 [Bacteroidota bacterium]